MGRIEGKVAFITGAGHGQGRSHAVRFAAEGANLVLCDRCAPVEHVDYEMATADELAETVALCEQQGAKVVSAQTDVRSFPDITALVADALAVFGGIDVVVANAGVISYEHCWELSEEQFDTVVAINLKGVWNSLRAVIPSMIEREQGGALIITSSSAGLRGHPFMSHYSASKHGVVGMAKSMANELAQFDIRVNTVHPSGVASNMSAYPKGLELLDREPELFVPVAKNILPDAFILQPEDISNAVLWLASEEAKYVTGIQLPVDAGNTVKP